MLTKYEMLFKTDTVCQKADAKNQMLKNVNMIYQVTNIQRKSWNIKKKTKEESEYVTVPKQFKTNEFQNGMFLKPSSYYKYRGDNLQHSVVSNNETQSRNSRAVALCSHARLRFNSSMSSLQGAFDFFCSLYFRAWFVPGPNYPISASVWSGHHTRSVIDTQCVVINKRVYRKNAY